MANMLCPNSGIQIPLDELQFSYARSGGPGGQNVNKVASKAVLRWPVTVSPSLPDDVRARFVEKFANRITVDGDFVLSSQQTRDQRKNVEDCLDRLKDMIDSVAVPPTPRVATEPGRGAKERRMDTKREHSQKKQQRRWRGDY